MSNRICNFLSIGKKEKAQNAARDKDRDKTSDSLFEIFRQVFDRQAHYLDDQLVRSFHIILEDLQVDENEQQSTSSNAQDVFFKPYPLKALPAFDPNDKATQNFLQSTYTRWEKGSQYDSYKFFADGVANYVSWVAAGCKRITPGSENRRTNLMWERGWEDKGLCPHIVNENFLPMLCYGRDFYAVNGFVAHGDSQREATPHVIMTMQHFFEGDERISRAEILAILSVMMTQLDHDALKSHYITPVMIISCIGSKEGRILQAHITENGVVIQKTKLQSFRSVQDLKNSGDLFSRYMASERIGKTKRPVSLDLGRLQKIQVPMLKIQAAESEIIASSSENIAPSLQQDPRKGKEPVTIDSDDATNHDGSKHVVHKIIP